MGMIGATRCAKRVIVQILDEERARQRAIKRGFLDFCGFLASAKWLAKNRRRLV